MNEYRTANRSSRLVAMAAGMAIVFTCGLAQAKDYCYYTASSGNWSNDVNWSYATAANTEPTNPGGPDTAYGDFAFIGHPYGQTYNNVTVTESGEICQKLYVGAANNTTGILTIASGTLYDNTTLAVGSGSGSLGELHVAGGTFTMDQGQNYDPVIGGSGQGLLEITAGEMTFTLRDVSPSPATATNQTLHVKAGSRFRVDDTLNSITGITLGDPAYPTTETNYHQYAGATLEVIPGSGGLTTIEVEGRVLFESGALLEVGPEANPDILTVLTADEGIVDLGLQPSGDNVNFWTYEIVNGTGNQQSLQVTFKPLGTAITIR